MAFQIGKAFLQRRKVFLTQMKFFNSTVKFQRSRRYHQYCRVRLQTRNRADDVEKLLGPEIRGESALGNDIISEFQRHPGSNDGVIAMGDIGERAAVDKRGLSFQGLNQIGFDGIFQKCRHRPDSFQIPGIDRFVAPVIGH